MSLGKGLTMDLQINICKFSVWLLYELCSIKLSFARELPIWCLITFNYMHLFLSIRVSTEITCQQKIITKCDVKRFSFLQRAINKCRATQSNTLAGRQRGPGSSVASFARRPPSPPRLSSPDMRGLSLANGMVNICTYCIGLLNFC